MKRYLIALSVIGFFGCKKSQEDLKAVSSFKVVNAAINIASARVYAADHLIFWKTLPASEAVSYANSGSFATFAGGNNIRAVSAADTTIVIYANTKPDDFKQGAFNTLFLCGQSPSYEGILMLNDNLP